MPNFDPGISYANSPAVDRLRAGDIPWVTITGTLLSGQNVARGAALGIVTASGKWKLSASAAGDGSEKIRGIAVDACDATSADQRIGIAVKGSFNPAAVTFGTGHTSASAFTACLDQGIVFKSNVP